ncbi:helicase-related protein [Mariniblastus sp.]|nr:helicase-related protein [Mariniblastus sp.]
MSRLEEITKDAVVQGILAHASVTIIDARWHGTTALEVTYKAGDGMLGSELLYRHRESTLEVVESGLPWSFTGDGNLLRLVSEAMRIKLAYLFDPVLAVHTSLVDPYPHQITAVYEEMLTRQPLRFLLADDPGAGKTIMAGLLIKELLIRGDLKRCMIVAPGNLVEQWQDEMMQKFHIPFEVMTNDKFESAHSGNWFLENNLVVCRLDKLSRNESVQEKLKVTDWDLIVVDEAHKMSAAVFGNEIKETKRYKLGKFISTLTRHFLLMTATPHNGKEEDFQLFMALLDSDRFAGKTRNTDHVVDANDMMRRMVKEQLYKFDETKLFPERRAYTVNYELSDDEASLYDAVSEYVQNEFNRANAIENGGRRGTVGFAMTILQRRLASSPEAIYQSLCRRKGRLKTRIEEESRNSSIAEDKPLGWNLPTFADEDDIEDFEDKPGQELEEQQEIIVDGATAAQTIAQLQLEIESLKVLEKFAKKVRDSGHDRKWEELSALLRENEHMRDETGAYRKLVIFTEHRDTLSYLARRIRTLYGSDAAVVTITGGMSREQRRKSQELFTHDKETLILLATDAAGEGINLQCAHLMVNYDLPWNPNRLEQRFGRIHRIGQAEVCHLWNLVAAQTREGAVFQRLLEKLEVERKALGGAVFDVLGQAIEGKQLRKLLQEAVFYGNQPEVRAKLFEKVEGALNHERLAELIEGQSLAQETMDTTRVRKVRDTIERANARRLQPHYTSAFFKCALELLGGQIKEREKNRYEISRVPASIRNRDRVIGSRETVLKQYRNATFHKDRIHVHGEPTAAFICPGHPILDSTIDFVLERNSDLLKQGAILIDDTDRSKNSRALFYLEHSIQDGRPIAGTNQRRIVSRQMQFVSIDKDHKVSMAGPAPYLDLRGATEQETKLVQPLLKEDWISSNLENQAISFAISEMVPKHIQEIKQRRESLVDKTNNAVKQRLSREIAFWNRRADELQAQEASGKQPKMNSQKARSRAEELDARLQKRLEELAQERRLAALPPVVTGGALVIPIGLIKNLCGGHKNCEIDQARKVKYSDRLAIDIVMEAERKRGHKPRDVSDENCSYDIESKDGQSGRLRLLKVKGVIFGVETVPVTHNEIVTSVNSRENYSLVIVQIKEDDSVLDPVYVRDPFEREPDFNTASIDYKLIDLLKKGLPAHEQIVDVNN